MRTRIAAAVVVGSSLIGQGAGAQQFRVGFGHSDADHALLGSPTVLSASVQWRVMGALGMRVGIQRGQDRFTSVGTTCSGLVGPDDECGAETRSERPATLALTVSAPLTGSSGRGEVSLVPELRRLTVRSRQEGTTTGRVRNAEKVLYGLGIGLEAAWHVWRSPLVSIHVGVHTATHPWFREEIVADGYTPFERTVRLSWAEAGISVRPGG